MAEVKTHVQGRRWLFSNSAQHKRNHKGAWFLNSINGASYDTNKTSARDLIIHGLAHRGANGAADDANGRGRLGRPLLL